MLTLFLNIFHFIFDRKERDRLFAVELYTGLIILTNLTLTTVI